MRQPTAQETALWRRKLAESGFRDLELGTVLSNRGTPTRTGIVQAASYYEKAAAVDPAGLDQLAAEIWRLHVDKVSVRGIASRLRRRMGGRAGGRFEKVRRSIIASRAALFGNHARQGAQGAQGGQCEKQKQRRLLKSSDLDTQTLVELVAALTSRSSARTNRPRAYSAISSSSSGRTSIGSSSTSPPRTACSAPTRPVSLPATFGR